MLFTADSSAAVLSAVAETAPESVAEEKDNMNAVQQLSREATAVNHNFSQQVLQQEGPKYDCGQPSPFVAEGKEQLAPVAYRSVPGAAAGNSCCSVSGKTPFMVYCICVNCLPYDAKQSHAFWSLIATTSVTYENACFQP